MENEGLEKLVDLLKKMKEKTEELLNEQFGHVCEWDEKPPEVTVIDAPCHCGARVICSKAIEEAEPLHIIKEEQLVHLQGLVILNKTDTRLDGVFSGCIAGTEKTACTIGDGTGIVDNEWKGAGETFDEGEGKDEITKENAYMICERGGVIHFLEISEELGEVIKKMDEKVREPDLVIDWLKLYRTPTVPFPGRSVPKHKFQTIFCLFAVVFCMACFFAASKTGQGDSEVKGGHQTQDASTEDMQDRLIIVSSGDESTEQEDKPLLSSESAEKNMQGLPCEDDTVNAELNPDQEDTAQKALQAYEEFLDGESSVGDIDILYLTTPTGEPDKRFAIQYVILDSNGDDVPELHTRGREFYVFTYKNDQMDILKGFFSYPAQYTLLTDGKFAHWEERGDPLWNYFSCFRLDNDGNKIDRISFWWTDTNENCVRDEEDEYVFDDRECTMEEWILKKEAYLYVGDDGWEHFRNEAEWITYRRK